MLLSSVLSNQKKKEKTITAVAVVNQNITVCFFFCIQNCSNRRRLVRDYQKPQSAHIVTAVDESSQHHITNKDRIISPG